jgi:hypothetical protein
MPRLDQIARAIFYAKEEPQVLAEMLYDSVPALQDLEGAVTITGTLKYNQELTCVVTGITNNTGTLSYKWKRNGVAIASATNAKYTTIADDIGTNLTCEVTSSVQQDVLVGVASAVIAKADGATAPNVTGASASITGLSASSDYEYKLHANTEWIAVVDAATSISGLVAGSYDVRIVGTATTLPSAIKTVTVS